MDTTLLAIDNIFTPNSGAGQALSTPTQNTSWLTNNPSVDSTTAPKTTDNNLTNSQSTPTNKKPQDFHDTLQEKIRDEAPHNTQDDPELKEQDTTADTTPPQPADPQDTTTAQQNKTTGTEMPVEPQAVEKPTQSEELPLSGTPNADGSEPQIALSTTISKALKLLLLTTPAGRSIANKPLLNQPAPKTIPSDTSTGSLNIGTSGEVDENTEKIPASNKLIVAANDLANQQNSKDSVPDALIAGSKTTPAGEKTEITDTPAAANQKTSTLTTKELTLEATTTSEKPANNKTNVSPGAATGATANQILSEPSTGKPQSSGHLAAQQGNNPSGEAVLQKLNPAQVQVSTNQPKNPTGSGPNSNSNTDFNQMLSHNSTQIPLTEQSSFSSQTVKAADNALPGNPPPTISEQILGSIHSSLYRGSQQITIHLNPPELGKVFIKFDQQQDQITGLLEVSKAQTRAEIQQALPQIIQTLADSGIQIKRIEVVLTDQSDQQPYKDQSLQDNPLGQHSFTDGGNPENSSTNPPGSGLTGDSSYQSGPEQQQMFITENSINMLI